MPSEEEQRGIVTPPQRGPYLKAALFCDQVIEGKDGVLSLIRVVDRLTRTIAGPEAPPEMPPVTHRMVAVLMLTSGHARGRHDIRLEVEPPDPTKRRDVWSGTIHFEGEDKGHNLVVSVDAQFEVEGLYWFNVYLEDQLFTRMPFRVLYTRFSTGAQ